ncbi:MAG: deoxyribose-phosphate aldolase [Sulfobacillus acidophilus]|uniref:Deoxyribose-phosphate aldolase n=1 Tax=Sulfobacillus acidophilus TaxID=53633 RepID=A0A2T2WNW1_9FIRM|nr:MAG: deoxyribose-phosphate aldolase [Sulfobacillus acidophilus]
MNQWNEWYQRIEPYLSAEEQQRLLQLTRTSWSAPVLPNRASLARYIDHTALYAEITPSAIERLCQEAQEWGTYSICINSQYVPLAHTRLGDAVQIAAVVGFPLGAMATPAKAYEAQWCVDQGAQELDMVIAIGYLKAGAYDAVLADLRAVRAAAPSPVILKVILETGLLTTDEKGIAALLSVAAGADFVKTSTGFGHGGATVEDVALLRDTVGATVGVKASGGIHSWQEALDLVAAGANRLGMSKTGVVLGRED